MLGAIYIGLSGMDAYSQGLQTISNNVANLNTLGYKSQTISFSDVYSAGGGGLSLAQGGQSSGAGVRSNAPGRDFSQGTLQQTNNPLDLAIQGKGFLVLQSGHSTVYTRTGSFGVDKDGFLALQGAAGGASYRLSVLDSANQPTSVNVKSKSTNPPVATTTITLQNNLSSTGDTATVSNVSVFDSNGGVHTWTIKLTPVTTTSGGVTTRTPGHWTVSVTDETGASVGGGEIVFNGGVIDPTSAKLVVSAQPAGASPLSVTVDFSNVTSFSSGSTSTLQTASVDGAAPGSLSTVTIDATGNVTLTYSNGKTVNMGAVALADFEDAGALQAIGQGLYKNTSGQALRLLASGGEGVGALVSSQLEASNVNLTQDFGSLILIQRGFQASSEVVSVSNDMIQQLFGIRGHG